MSIPGAGAGPDGPQSPIQSFLTELYLRHQSLSEGALASYIPELATVEPDRFGIAVAAADGFVYAVGDAGTAFTLQSISKPIVYGLALLDHGRDAVLRQIGLEPSGDAFNSVAFDEENNRPFNPMVNAGAIVATSLVVGESPAHRLRRMLDLFGAFVGHPVEVDEDVYRSEAATGHRNRAIAYLALNAGMIAGDVDAHLDLYFRQCAIRVTARDLAVMGATLANGGINPVTGEEALPVEHVRDVLSIMTTCGMYDYAGEWEFRVGLPAKSGVGGGIIAVLPGQLGIGVYSPRLDGHGNSLRGIRVCEDLSARLKLHLLDSRGGIRTAVRRRYSGAAVRSKRMRQPAATRLLDELGSAISVYELQGDLSFANTEQVVRRIVADTEASHVVIDAARVGSADAVSLALLTALYENLARAGRTAVLVALPAAAPDVPTPPHDALAADIDEALERCEDDLLRGAAFAEPASAPPLDLADVDLLIALDDAERAALSRHLVPASFRSGETIIREGSAADSLFILLAGEVDVRVAAADDGRTTVIGTVEAGNVFGELALFDSGRRTADVVARTDATVLMLDAARFAALYRTVPTLHDKLLIAVGRSLSDRLRRANAVIRALTA